MTADALPATVPIFPLSGALLLPYGQLPLNIFEPRYVALIEDALAGGRFMGMVQPRDADGETVANDGAIFEIGCLGRITSFTDPGDGRYEIVLSGTCRFRIAEELPMQRGYRRVTADFGPFLGDLDPTAAEIANRPQLLAAMKGYFRQRNLEADWQALDEVPDLVLVTTAAMGCPIKPQEKQLLLEAPDVAARAERLQAILEMAQHEPSGPAARH
ncbi:MAG: LON peptidase substrate-binding domain-containing protein [Rhodospirillaceae bacterium]